jgi:predicted dehydrogenase
MAQTIRWGILGTGGIARGFAEGLKVLPDAKLQAVASRTQEKADRFAREVGAVRGYGDYAALVSDREIDAVYIATPHHRHKDDCLLCLDAGKPVLCEKPFTVDAAEAREVMTRAREKGVFCMEAMWMRFMPLILEAREQIKRGAIGEPRALLADFGYPTPYDPESRFFNRELGGGALLDRGVYGISLAYFLFGRPSGVSGAAGMAPTGVDEQSVYTLTYPDGKIAQVYSSLGVRSTNAATIMGTQGRLTLTEPFFSPAHLRLLSYEQPQPENSKANNGGGGLASRLKQNPAAVTLYRAAKKIMGSGETVITRPVTGNGYNYEASEVMRCLRAGEKESPIMPLHETVAIMETMDSIRKTWI